jgi:hypothetical protein
MRRSRWVRGGDVGRESYAASGRDAGWERGDTRGTRTGEKGDTTKALGNSRRRRIIGGSWARGKTVGTSRGIGGRPLWGGCEGRLGPDMAVLINQRSPTTRSA